MATDVEIPGFVPRKNGSDYGRSETSLRRDFRNAVHNNDDVFRTQFIVRTKDGVEHNGSKFSDVTEFERKGLKPEWYVSLELLNSRYWEKKNTQPKQKQAKARQATSTTLTDASEIQKLQHELAIANERIAQKDETIEILKSDKEFYKDELTNRRGELKEMTAFVDTVRIGIEASKSKKDESDPWGDKDNADTGSANDSSVENTESEDVQDAVVVEKSGQGTGSQASSATKKTIKRKKPQKKAVPKKATVFQKHTPTFHNVWSRFRRNV